ncbi:MAG: RimK family alpha-L-glutamate ligase [Actinobacteria bacterium]|nr:RimK family alpha-L-glutamate ligase [Actinomycetota bacterium]
MKIWILEKRKDFDSYTSKRFIETAKKMDVELKLVAPEELDLIVTKEGNKSILFNGNLIGLPDCLIPRVGTVTYYALAIIRHLERLGVFILNSSQSMETSKDKLATLQLLASNNIPIPKTMLAKFPLDISVIEREFDYPLIIKTITGSKGRGVFLLEDRNKLNDLANLMEISKDPKINLILQEFISSSRGRDIRVIVLGGRVIGAMLRTAVNNNFKANYSAGGVVAPFGLNPVLEWLAIESSRLINLDIAGVDILFDGDNYRICEINSYPGFEGFEKATGINVAEEVFKYIQVRLEGGIE